MIEPMKTIGMIGGKSFQSWAEYYRLVNNRDQILDFVRSWSASTEIRSYCRTAKSTADTSSTRL